MRCPKVFDSKREGLFHAKLTANATNNSGGRTWIDGGEFFVFSPLPLCLHTGSPEHIPSNGTSYRR